MSDRAFIAAMEALQHEQEAHILTLRRDAAQLMNIADLTPEDAEDHLLAIDVKEAMQHELLSTIALMHEFEGT